MVGVYLGPEQLSLDPGACLKSKKDSLDRSDYPILVLDSKPRDDFSTLDWLIRARWQHNILVHYLIFNVAIFPRFHSNFFSPLPPVIIYSYSRQHVTLN